MIHSINLSLNESRQKISQENFAHMHGSIGSDQDSKVRSESVSSRRKKFAAAAGGVALYALFNKLRDSANIPHSTAQDGFQEKNSQSSSENKEETKNSRSDLKQAPFSTSNSRKLEVIPLTEAKLIQPMGVKIDLDRISKSNIFPTFSFDGMPPLSKQSFDLSLLEESSAASKRKNHRFQYLPPLAICIGKMYKKKISQPHPHPRSIQVRQTALLSRLFPIYRIAKGSLNRVKKLPILIKKSYWDSLLLSEFQTNRLLHHGSSTLDNRSSCHDMVWETIFFEPRRLSSRTPKYWQRL